MSDEKSTTIAILPTPIDPVELRRQYTESLIPPSPPKLFYPIATVILAGCVVAAVMTVIGVLATYGVHSNKSTTTTVVTPEICRFQMDLNGLSVYITPNNNITIPTTRGSIVLLSNTTYINGMMVSVSPTRTTILNLTISSNQMTYIQNQLVRCTIVPSSSSSSSSSSTGVVPPSSSSSTGTMIVLSSTGAAAAVAIPSSSASSSSSVSQDSSSSTGVTSASTSDSSSSSSGTNQ